MNKEQYASVVSKVWAELGNGNTFADMSGLADKIQIDRVEFTQMFSSREKLILSLIEDVWGQLDLPPPQDKLTARDQIFDTVMMAFDKVSPYRSGIKKLCHELMFSPSSYIELTPRLHRFGSDLISGYIKVDGLLGSGIVIAFNGAFATTFWTFLDDDSFDLSKTMSSLDGALKTVSSLLAYCPGMEKIE